jgi:hypothetical protein
LQGTNPTQVPHLAFSQLGSEEESMTYNNSPSSNDSSSGCDTNQIKLHFLFEPKPNIHNI